jgi:hypothetical protein
MFSFRFDGASNWNNEPLDMRVSTRADWSVPRHKFHRDNVIVLCAEMIEMARMLRILWTAFCVEMQNALPVAYRAVGQVLWRNQQMIPSPASLR